MEIKDYVKQFRDLQKSHKKVRVADFCRENMLDYYEMVEALKQEKLEVESYEEQVQCGDLVMQTEAQENKIQEKDSEVLRLLNQIATDMIRKSDVDRLVEEAVATATAALKADYEERMKAMAAEYEAKIAELQNQKDGKGDDKDQTPGKSTKNSRKKGGTVICNTMEEAMQRIQEEMNKAAVMQDQAFGGGSEKLSSEQKSAVNPEEENADDDSKVQSPVNPRGDYGERNSESKPRPEEYSNYIKVDKEDEITVDCYPDGCDENNINPYDYWSDLIDFIGCELLEQRRHTKASFLFAES